MGCLVGAIFAAGVGFWSDERHEEPVDQVIRVFAKVIIGESVVTLLILVSVRVLLKVLYPYVGLRRLNMARRLVQMKDYLRVVEKNAENAMLENNQFQSVQEENRRLEEQTQLQQQNIKQLQQQQQQQQQLLQKQERQVPPAPPRSGYEPDGYETLPNVPAPSYDKATNG